MAHILLRVVHGTLLVDEEVRQLVDHDSAPAVWIVHQATELLSVNKDGFRPCELGEGRCVQANRHIGHTRRGGDVIKLDGTGRNLDFDRLFLASLRMGHLHRSESGKHKEQENIEKFSHDDLQKLRGWLGMVCQELTTNFYSGIFIQICQAQYVTLCITLQPSLRRISGKCLVLSVACDCADVENKEGGVELGLYWSVFFVLSLVSWPAELVS